jgi:hypothetical protein
VLSAGTVIYGRMDSTSMPTFGSVPLEEYAVAVDTAVVVVLDPAAVVADVAPAAVDVPAAVVLVGAVTVPAAAVDVVCVVANDPLFIPPERFVTTSTAAAVVSSTAVPAARLSPGPNAKAVSGELTSDAVMTARITLFLKRIAPLSPESLKLSNAYKFSTATA